MKIRVFLIDDATARPAGHVQVEAWASQKNSGEAAELQLGVLQSDASGYLAFELPPDLKPESLTKLSVRPVGVAEAAVNLTEKWRVNGGTQALVVGVPNASRLAAKAGLLPAVQSPDVVDWNISPRSFTTAPAEILGQDGCETLLISNAALESYRFTQIIPGVADEEEVLEVASASPCATDADGEVKSACVKRGALVEYETEWVPLGHGLGEVLYSLPLAPCESVQLAIIDWQRADAAQRAEESGVSEELAHDQRRDRGIEEAVRGAVGEWQRGGTVMGAAGGTYSYGTGSLAASVGASYSTSAGDRNATADTVQRLGDAFTQASRNARRLQSTVVVQASQRESEQLQTRTVTNHNHCHALTVLYYEIVRHFRVRTSVADVQDALLVRHPEQFFDRPRARRERQTLRPVLRDEGVLPGFDALERPLEAAPASPQTRYGAVDRLVVKVTTGEHDPQVGGAGGAAPNRLDLLVLSASAAVRKFDLENHMIPSAHDVDEDDFLYKPRQTNTFEIPLDPPIPLSAFAQVGLHFRRDLHRTMDLAGLEVLGSVEREGPAGTTRELLVLFSDPAVNKFFEDDGEWWGGVRLPAAPPGPPDRGADDRSASRLLEHLNDHREFYNRVVWLAEDAGRRAALFSHYRFEAGGVTGRLADFVENRVVDVLGDYVVIPLGTDELAPKLVEPGVEADQRVVSLPGRGAFAEAKLSRCNACEQIDDTRFWDWQDSPCPGAAPDISGVTPGSRDRAPDAAPSPLPEPNLGVEEPGTAPDPGGIAGVLQLLGRSDVFRDMSGRPELAAVMTSVVNGAVQLSQEQMRQRTEQQRIQQQAALERQRIQASQGQHSPAAAASGASTRAGSAASAPSPVDERERAFRQGHNAVHRAEQAGTYSPTESQELHRELTEAQVTATTQDPLSSGLDYTLVGYPETSSSTRVRYEPGEADASLGSPGLVTFRGTLERVLYNFGVNEPSAVPALKPEHEAFLSDMIRELGLTGANPSAQLELIEGYTDLVDTEAINANLRSRRAEAVRAWLSAHGVPDHRIGRVGAARAGELLTDNRTPESRAGNRAVLIRLNPVRPVQLPPERVQPLEHRSTQWELAPLMSVAAGEVIRGTAALFRLTDRSLPDRPSHEIWFGGPGVGVGGRVPGPLPRLPPWRPGVGLGLGGTKFHTTVPLRFEDFELAIGTMVIVQAGFMFSYGIGYVQIAGQRAGQRWGAVSDDEGYAGGTTLIWIGGLQTTNIDFGGDAGGFFGVWTYLPGELHGATGPSTTRT